MKNKLICILAACLAYLSIGCTRQEIPLFQEKSGVFFTSLKTTYSFRDHFGVEVDTVYMNLSLFGDTTNVDRTVNVKVVEPDSVLLASPDRYRVLSGVIPAGKFEGQVAIEINNGPELADTVYSIYLEIAPNNDFPELVEFNNSRTRLEISDVRIPPANWYWLQMFYFGKYEDEWWDYILQVTGKSSLPWDPIASDKETWWMTDVEITICARAVKNALKEYELRNPGKKLCYKNGDPWMDTLRLNPIVYKAGTDDAKLSYEWVLTDIDGIPTVLGNTMQLNAEITVPASANTYDLLFTVTDNETGLQGYKSFTVAVNAPLGGGC